MALPMLDALGLDIKQAFRRLLRNPGYTLTAVLSLALGVGANTAIFRVMNAVRFRNLPVSNPQQLVEIKVAGGTRGFGISSSPAANATFPLWQELYRHQPALSGSFAWSANNIRFGEGADSRLVRGLWVSPQVFRVLNIPAIRGRMFEGDDDHCDASVAVISSQFWLAHFAGHDSAIGSSIQVEDRPLSIIGVAPQGFFGLEAGRGFDVAVPLCARLAADPNFRRKDLWWLTIMGRLAPGVTTQALDAQLKTVGRGMFDAVAPAGYDAQAMDVWKSFQLTAVHAPGGISRLRDEYDTSLWLLFAIGLMVLLIACSNLVNLLLVQAASRETEFALRLALGMGRARLAAQVMTENLVLAIFGTATGSALGSMLSSFLVTVLSTTRDPIQLNLGGDWRMLMFTAALALLICGLLSLAPLLRLAGTNVALAIRGGRGGSHQSHRSAFQGALVGSQLAISLLLLVASLSFVRSFRSLSALDTGFRQNGLIFCLADFSRLRLASARLSVFQSELLQTVQQTAGVELAATSTHVPLSGDSWTLGVRVAGRDEEGSARFSWISDSYFRALGIPVIAGRGFTISDSTASKRALIVNETFARQFTARSRAVGTLVRSIAEPGYPMAEYEIVGVVKDTKYDSLREKISPAAYAPESQNPNLRPWTSIILRTSAPAASTIGAAGRALSAKVPGIRMHFESLQTMADDSMARDKLLAWLSGLFAAVATLLTCIGLYGVISYVVSLRRSEIAVRMALGATPPQIIGMVVRSTAIVAGAGALAGLLLSLAGGRFARSLLFNLEPGDPLTLVSAVAALLAISILASLYPALRASWIKPASALRGQ